MHNDNNWLWNLNVPHDQNLRLANTVAINGIPSPSPSSCYTNVALTDLGIRVGMRNVKLHCDSAQFYSPKISDSHHYNSHSYDPLNRGWNDFSGNSSIPFTHNIRTASHETDSFLQNSLYANSDGSNLFGDPVSMSNLQQLYSRIQQLSLSLPPQSLITASAEHSWMQHRNLYSSDVATYYFDRNLKSRTITAATNHTRKLKSPTSISRFLSKDHSRNPMNILCSSANELKSTKSLSLLPYFIKPKSIASKQLPSKSEILIEITQHVDAEERSYVAAPKKKWIRNYIQSKSQVYSLL